MYRNERYFPRTIMQSGIMIEEADHIRVLIKKYLEETLTVEEQQQLEAWATKSPANRQLVDQLTDKYCLRDLMREYSLVTEPLAFTDVYVPKVIDRNRKKYWYVTALLMFIVILLSTIFYANHFNNQPIIDNEPLAKKVLDVAPGSQMATLLLADNRVINLTDHEKETVLQNDQVVISKIEDGSLVYKAGNSTGNIAIHTLTTPKGGFYNISLADGTRVWLNAATSVRYPSIFHGTHRRVELAGEAYFEVANNILPFVVATSKATIEVTGTKFNCSAYNDENIITTLLEGSVRIIANNRNVATPVVTTVKAGQQVIMDKKTSLVDIKTVYAETSVAWKNGSFYFDHSDITEVMRQVARWYDVDIVYDPVGTGAGQLLTGQLERNVPLSNLLEQLERIASVKFEVKGKIITVRKP